MAECGVSPALVMRVTMEKKSVSREGAKEPWQPQTPSRLRAFA
jgi:hypothetical protein